MDMAPLSIGSDLPLLPPLAGLGGATLNRKQKAAIVVRVLLAEGARLSLAELPDTLQAELARQMSEMRFVDRRTLGAVVEEFLSEIEEIGLSFPPGMEGALTILDGTISPATASRLRKQAGLGYAGDPWERIAELDASKLADVVARESIEVGAVLLAKLRVPKAAELLGALPGPTARKLAYAVSLTGSIAPPVVRKIGLSLAAELDAQPATAFSDGPVARVGAILNFSPAATRDDVLAGLDETDAGFADKVRKAIFTFANIPERIAPRDCARILREVEGKVLAEAIAAALAAGGSLEAAAEYLLANISQRLATQIREEAGELGPVKAKEGEEAMAAIVAKAREMEAAGEIFFVAGEE